nr:uncharacterized protein LOC129010481 isoform X2 [Pongo pygmaeus]
MRTLNTSCTTGDVTTYTVTKVAAWPRNARGRCGDCRLRGDCVDSSRIRPCSAGRGESEGQKERRINGTLHKACFSDFPLSIPRTEERDYSLNYCSEVIPQPPGVDQRQQKPRGESLSLAMSILGTERDRLQEQTSNPERTHRPSERSGLLLQDPGDTPNTVQ